MTAASERPPAVVLGSGHPGQTAFVKSLARFGVPVHAVYSEQNESAASRRLTRFHLLDGDSRSQLEYIENLGRQFGRGFLIPTNDDYVALVAQNRERLSRHFAIPLPGWEVIGEIFDRARCYAKASAAGIRVPDYWVPDSEAAMEQVVANLHPAKSDYIIKTSSIVSASGQRGDHSPDESRSQTAPRHPGSLPGTEGTNPRVPDDPAGRSRRRK